MTFLSRGCYRDRYVRHIIKAHSKALPAHVSGSPQPPAVDCQLSASLSVVRRLLFAIVIAFVLDPGHPNELLAVLDIDEPHALGIPALQ